MLVPEVDPEDVFLVSILLEDRLQTLLKPINCSLTCAEDGESWQLKKKVVFKINNFEDNQIFSYSSEVWGSISPGSTLSKSVNAFKGISHSLEVSYGRNHLESVTD